MTCRSVLTRAESPGSRLVEYPCRLDAGHHGECSHGRHRWTRLGEVLRQRGQIVDGPRVRRLA